MRTGRLVGREEGGREDRSARGDARAIHYKQI